MNGVKALHPAYTRSGTTGSKGQGKGKPSQPTTLKGKGKPPTKGKGKGRGRGTSKGGKGRGSPFRANVTTLPDGQEPTDELEWITTDESILIPSTSGGTETGDDADDEAYHKMTQAEAEEYHQLSQATYA